MSLVLHFTEPDATLVEIRRILRPGGMLIAINLDMPALRGLDRVRSLGRVIYRGVAGYRTKPPKRFGGNVMTEDQLRERLGNAGFRVVHAETIRDPSRSSNIPVEFVKAVTP
jgi:ubiquinone/menaquinone biosynthesis C-methylase UbiE